MTDKPTDETPPDFMVFFASTNKGRTSADVSEKFAELIKACTETGKSGRIQITFDVKPVKGTDGEQVYVTDTVVAKIPTLDRPVSIFYTSEDGGLHRTDPRQHALPFGQESNAR